MEKQPLVVLTGPTAAGKTKLSIELARAINGEIISADSMQVYRHMDIGSAKIRPEEMEGIPHYLVDILEPTQDFNVVLFQKYAKDAMAQIYAKGKIPILVGGTGFYIQSVLYDIDFTQNDEDTQLREELEQIAGQKGAEYLHQMLEKVDAASAKAIHPNNVKRVIRALEFYEKTGRTISSHNEQEREKESPYNAAYFVLNDDRNEIYRRIDQRVDQMMQAGLIEEVRRLKDRGYTKDMVSMQGLGYKEILDYLDGNTTLEEAVYILKRDTRHFAKRQLTWFRREREVIWVEKEKFSHDNEKILDFMKKELTERGIL